MNRLKVMVSLGGQEPVSYSFLDHDNMNGLAPCTLDMFCKRWLPVAGGFWGVFFEAHRLIREECTPLILEDAAGHESASVPPRGSFPRSCFWY